MTFNTKESAFFIGWDVGAWNCGRNSKSRDAIVILDECLSVVGTPWRGNLRDCIRDANDSTAWLKALFTQCDAVYPAGSPRATMAIDTPLGFSVEFIRLVTGNGCVEPDPVSGRNHYLFRLTERVIFGRGKVPLSAIKDMIGSQATKGMHALAKFAPRLESCGVWTDGRRFHAIETYPAACHDSAIISRLLEAAPSLGNADKDDARICAVVAHLFATQRHSLVPPPTNTSSQEGWIWIPSPAQ